MPLEDVRLIPLCRQFTSNVEWQTSAHVVVLDPYCGKIQEIADQDEVSVEQEYHRSSGELLLPEHLNLIAKGEYVLEEYER